MLENESPHTRYLRIVEKYYKEDVGYLRREAQLELLIRGIRGQCICIDLEGVLVTGREIPSDLLHVQREPDIEEEISVGVEEVTGEHENLLMDEETPPIGVNINDYKVHVKRPLAQELLDFLTRNRNTVSIWTATTREDSNRIIRTSGLMVPGGVHVVTREQTAQKVAGYLDSHPEIVPDNSALWRSIQEGKRKVLLRPNTILADDKATSHQEACHAICRPADANRILQVTPFEILSADHLFRAHKNNGLLVFIEALHTYYKSKNKI